MSLELREVVIERKKSGNKLLDLGADGNVSNATLGTQTGANEQATGI